MFTCDVMTTDMLGIEMQKVEHSLLVRPLEFECLSATPFDVFFPVPSCKCLVTCSVIGHDC